MKLASVLAKRPKLVRTGFVSPPNARSSMRRIGKPNGPHENVKTWPLAIALMKPLRSRWR